MRLLQFWTFLFFLLASTSIDGQVTESTSEEPINDQTLISDVEPRIGLALSGGAAHGLAHIGVIKYMEELEIPVDYITGTSMGSIVGGLMAMGYDADDMMAITEELNWDEILSNRTKLDRIAPLEKFYHDKFPILFTLQDRELFLPRGFIRGQMLDMTLSRVFFPALAIDNFDDLVIPYRCMAVDISTGEILTLDSGYLGQAIRASMAIPLMFSPVELDGRLLVDGGLIRNFPVEDNIKMGSDIVIGVYVGSEKEPKEELKSSFDILVQSTQMMGIIDSEKQMGLCDILIKPEVKEEGSLNFNNYKYFIQQGYEAAKGHHAEFMALKSRIAGRTDLNNEKLEAPSKMYVNRVTAPNTEPPLSEIILNRCGLGNRSYLELDEIDEGLSRIYGTKNFENLNYTFRQDENDEINLEINADPVRKTEVGATFNRFASTNSSIMLYGILRNKLSEPSRLSVLARLSDKPGFKIDYFKRFGHHRRVFFRAFSTNDSYDFPFFLDGDLRRLYKSINYDVGLNLGYETNNEVKIEGGIKFRSQSLKPALVQEFDFVDFDQNQLSVNIIATYNSFDRPAYATKGINAELRIRQNFARSIEESYTNIEAEQALKVDEDDLTFSIYGSLQKVYDLDQRITAISSGYLYARIGSSLLDNLSVGGTDQSRVYNVPFIGLGEGELLLENAIVLRQELRINPQKFIFLSAVGNIAFGKKAFGSLDMEGNNRAFTVGVGVNVGIDTPIGPIDLNFGSNSGNDSNVNLGAGYRFIF